MPYNKSQFVFIEYQTTLTFFLPHMNTLITLNAILERHSTPLSRNRINELLSKKESKLGKFYLYLDADMAEDKVAHALGYTHEKDKTYLMLKKRLRDFLEETVKFCDLGKTAVPESSYFEKLNHIVQLVRVMRKEQNNVLTHHYSQKGIKMAEETGHMEIWLECLKTELFYYHTIGNLQMLNETDQKIQKLTADINLMNRMMSFILREETEIRKPQPYDMSTWDQKTAYLEKEVSQLRSDALASSNKHVILAAITVELFVALRDDDGPRWRRLIEEGYELIGGNLNMNPTYTTFIYAFRAVSLILSENYDGLDAQLRHLAPKLARYPFLDFNFSTLKVSALLQQRRYDEAYRLFSKALKIKIPLKLQNYEMETRQDYITLLFLFLSISGKITLKPQDLRNHEEVMKKDPTPWQQDLRVYKLMLLYLTINDIAAQKINAAKRTFKKLQTHLEAYPFGPKVWRIQHLVAAIEQYLTHYPDRAAIEAHSHNYVTALLESDNMRSSDEFFSYTEIWSLLMHRLS